MQGPILNGVSSTAVLQNGMILHLACRPIYLHCGFLLLRHRAWDRQHWRCVVADLYADASVQAEARPLGESNVHDAADSRSVSAAAVHVAFGNFETFTGSQEQAAGGAAADGSWLVCSVAARQTQQSTQLTWSWLRTPCRSLVTSCS